MKYNAEALERLSRWIEKQGWSKREFARRMGIHETNVSKYLQGKVDLVNLEQKLIAEGLDLYWLQTGKTKDSFEAQAMLEMLYGMGIDSPEQLAKFLSPEDIIEDIIKTVQASFSRRVRK